MKVEEADLVRVEPLAAVQAAPMVVRPATAGVDLVGWAERNRGRIAELLASTGAVLLRGFAVSRVDTFERVVASAVGTRLAYTERSSPRTQVGDNVFTSTDYPPEYPIFLHNEQSYNLTFPVRIAFCCLQPAVHGGQTPIADTRRVLGRLRPDVRTAFARRGYALVRNYGHGLGLGWREAFQTDDRAAVERHCSAHEIAFEWIGDERLRTTQVRPAIAKHPHTGELTWFNHLTFFHTSSLPPAIRDGLTAQCAEADLPAQTYYGDLAPIEPEVLDHLRAAYESETVSFDWHAGDVLLLDNMLMAHSRAPYTPPRKVIVAMAELRHWRDVSVGTSGEGSYE
jgi:alpha-ketoglutarate-dependent taurine dioxygenase